MDRIIPSPGPVALNADDHTFFLKVHHVYNYPTSMRRETQDQAQVRAQRLAEAAKVGVVEGDLRRGKFDTGVQIANMAPFNLQGLIDHLLQQECVISSVHIEQIPNRDPKKAAKDVLVVVMQKGDDPTIEPYTEADLAYARERLGCFSGVAIFDNGRTGNGTVTVNANNMHRLNETASVGVPNLEFTFVEGANMSDHRAPATAAN